MRRVALVLSATLLLGAVQARVPTKSDYWQTVRRGANLFSAVERAERLRAAHDAGIAFVRLAPNKWLNGRPASERGNFLIGPRDGFTTLNPGDVRLLRSVLDDAEKAGLKVVVTMLSLPGSRWSQHAGGVEERAIWSDFAAQARAIECWRQLAAALRDHPAVVGYNLRNEPSPELVQPRLADWYTGDYLAWYAQVRNTPADLNLFYRKAVAAIREVDRDTPIVLDSGFFATPWAFKVLEPVEDTNVLYSFHMYEPYAYTNPRNDGRYRYPGEIPTGEGDQARVSAWNRAAIAAFFDPVVDWQRRHNVPSNRILVGEFGVVRTHAGVADYLRDVIAAIEANHWHWAFYAFREDEWPAMDYELGMGKPPAGYWAAHEAGRLPDPSVVYRPNALWDLISSALAGHSHP